ncbi:ribosome maturation factor RimM [Aquipuribacter sp. SD81]|uniref:ribosome maturation factor RimM n=1 Tax=Aquipuribacter sp. SD81 TaxID=3127703 RepID=UPI00301667E8
MGPSASTSSTSTAAEPTLSTTGPTPEAADDEPRWLVVGRLGRAHGLRGEVTVLLRTDDPERRLAPGAVLATDPDVGDLVVAGARTHQGRWLLALEGVADRDAAEALRDVELLVDATDDAPEPDAWHVADLVGLRAVSIGGHRLGTVTGLEHGPAQDLLVVRPAAGGPAVRVPFVTALVPEVDVAGGTVTLDPPGGLFEDPAGDG